MWHIMYVGDSWVSLEALLVPVLMQPKMSSDAHLCACYRVGQGQPLLGIAPFTWTECTSPSHFLHLQLPELLSQFWGQPHWSHAPLDSSCPCTNPKRKRGRPLLPAQTHSLNKRIFAPLLRSVLANEATDYKHPLWEAVALPIPSPVLQEMITLPHWKPSDAAVISESLHNSFNCSPVYGQYKGGCETTWTKGRAGC